eukprot:GHVH01010713.1.p1 GENE.GHVH01010713.1~~GHVH01010713.1.p1  ORF type:complete len:333 (-),score=35.00 GHVH01010713.1:36-1034(-)
MAEDAPWLEKYRPLSIDDISHQEVVKTTLRKVVETNTMPHFLFFGPPGTGKTTAVLALARTLYGDNWKKRTKEMNASDDRGIQAVRGEIKTFAEQMPASLPPRVDGKPYPNFKIIVLDEADMMTVDAQSCLRRLMEDHCLHTRFILICNYVSNIISPIQSRCASYRFEPVSEPSQISRLAHISTSEQFEIEEDAILQLVKRSGGDMRLAITTLYTLYCAGNKRLSSCAEVDHLMGFPHRDVVLKLLEIVRSQSTSEINQFVEDTVADGWDLELLFKSVSEEIIWSDKYSDVQKAVISQTLASGQCDLMKGVKEFTALMGAALEFQNVLTTMS